MDYVKNDCLPGGGPGGLFGAPSGAFDLGCINSSLKIFAKESFVAFR